MVTLRRGFSFKKLKKFLWFLVLLIAVGAAYLFTSKPVAADWADDAWLYRERVVFTNNTGSVATNQKVLVQFDTATPITAGKMQTSCQDVRFTDALGMSLQYYINISGGAGVGCNDASSDFYVLMPNIAVGNNLIYIYYGNPNAVAGTTSAQFSQSTFSPSAGPTAGTEENGPAPAAYWKFDEGQGTTAHDSSSNKNDLTITNGTWQPPDKCVGDRCLGLSGNGYATIADKTVLDFAAADKFTLQAWVRHTENDYKYRLPINITYSGSPLTNMQMRVTVDTATPIAAGKMQSNCNDIRFFDSDYNQNKPISYWITEGTCNSASTNIFIKLPSISGNETVYMAYGNPAAAAASNGNNVFLFFDDFDNGTTIDSGKWQAVGTGTVTQSGGAIHVGNATYTGQSVLVSNSSFSDLVVEARYKPTANDSFSYREAALNLRTDTNTANCHSYSSCFEDTSGSPYQHAVCFGAGTCHNEAGWVPNLSTWYIQKAVAHSNIYDFTTYADNYASVVASLNPGAYTDGNGSDFLTGYIGVYTIRNRKTDWDWFLARQYASTEPVVGSYGTESSVQYPISQSVIGKFNPGATGGGYGLYVNADGTYSFGITDTNSSFPKDTVSTPSDASSDQQWHQLTAVKDGTSSIKLYLDGLQVSSNYSLTASGTLNGNSAFYIGASADGTGRPWQGSIDDVKIFRYARTASQIQNDFIRSASSHGLSGTSSGVNAAGITNGLISYWKMDESSGNPADSSGNSLTLTNNGSTAFSAGKFGNAPTFDGSSKYFSLSNTITGIKSVAFWVKPANTTDNFLNLITGTAYVNSSSGVVAGTGFTGPVYYINGVMGGALTSGSWNYVVVTSTAGINANAFNIGRANGSYAVNNSQMDEIRLYSRTLNAAEVQQLYNFSPGPLVDWAFDDGSGTAPVDSSGNGYTGAFTGSPTWVNGKYGTALKFDGSSMAVTATIADPGAFNTVEVWVYPTASVVSKTLVTASKLTTNASSQPVYGGCTGTALSQNTWTHIAAVSTDTTHCTLYQNGIVTATSASTGLSFGTSLNVAASSYQGIMDDVRIYSYARTQKQVTEDMNAGHPAPGSPVGSAAVWYKFDEASGTTFNNSGNLGSSYNATDSGTLWNLSGKFDSAVQLNGASQIFASTPLTALFVNNGATYNALSWGGWFKPAGSAASKTLITKPNEFRLTTDSNSYPNCAIYSGSWQTAAISSSALSLNTWSHVWCTYDGSYIRVYLNGNLTGQVVQTGNLTSTNTTGLNLGWNFAGGEYFQGLMDDVKVYGSAFTSDQVSAELNKASALVLGDLGTDSTGIASNSAAAAFCVPDSSDTCTPPLGEWKFDENTGTTANDTSGHGATGSFTGSPTWVNGKFGSALKFDGSSQAVTATITDPGYANTVELWIYPTASVANKTLLTTGKLAFNGSSQPTYGSCTGTAVSTNQWSYIVATSTDSTHCTIYQNGIQTSSSATTGVTFGASVSVAVSSFAGIIDQVRIYGYVRTPAQIAYDYNRGAPIAWYRFDECQGNLAHNAALNANGTAAGMDGTITPNSGRSTGTCGSGTSTEMWNGGTTGKIGASLMFDGAGDYVTMGNQSVFDLNTTGDMTVTGWFNRSSFSNPHPIISKLNASSTGWIINIASSNGEFDYMAVDPSFNLFGMGTPEHFMSAGWNFFAVVIKRSSDSASTIYINGKQSAVVKSGTLSTLGDTTNTAALQVGAATSQSQYFNGQIDDIRIYNYPLTAAQVVNIYKAGAVKFGQ